jgi:hypothetical protein
MHHPGTYATELSVQARGDGRFEVAKISHAIDRRGEKDTFTDTLSVHDDQEEAIEHELAMRALIGEHL